MNATIKQMVGVDHSSKITDRLFFQIKNELLVLLPVYNNIC